MSLSISVTRAFVKLKWQRACILHQGSRRLGEGSKSWGQAWSDKIAGSDFGQRRSHWPEGRSAGCAEQTHSRSYELSEGHADY